jgi:transposase
MARPLSMDLRRRIAAAVEGGESRNATAERFAVSASAVIKLMQRFQTTGSIEPGQMGGWRDHALAAHEAVVRALIGARPDLTLEELRDALAEKGIYVGRSSVDRFLKARRLTLKKSRSTLQSRAGRT